MDRVERFVVQVSESNRLLHQGGLARWRISLMLLDNTAELLLKRECDSRLAWNSYRPSSLKRVEEAINRGETEEEPFPFDDEDEPPRLLADVRAELQRELASPDEVERIEREFGPKVAYLQRNLFLTPSHAAVLKRLHQYRNEIYHEDKIRPDTVQAAAKIYTYVVCDLMKRLTSTGIAVSINAPTPELDAMYPGRKHHPYTLDEYADDLLAQSPIDTAAKLAHTLSHHLIARLDELDDLLSFIATEGSNFGKIVSDERLSETLDEVLAMTKSSKKINYGTVRMWKGSARNLARSNDYVKAFEKFATTETALEDVEEPVHHVVRVIDQHIEDLIDERRGK